MYQEMGENVIQTAMPSLIHYYKIILYDYLL